MHFLIESAKAIKLNLIRFAVTMSDDEGNLVAEYEIALNIDPYIEYDVSDGRTNINVNAVGIQQELTTQIAEMQYTSTIAAGFYGLDWEATEGGKEETSEVNDEPEPATGDTEKLQPVLPEGK